MSQSGIKYRYFSNQIGNSIRNILQFPCDLRTLFPIADYDSARQLNVERAGTLILFIPRISKHSRADEKVFLRLFCRVRNASDLRSLKSIFILSAEARCT